MAVNWRDVQDRAEKFVIAYKDAKDEDRDAKPFWKDLMTIYGVEARSIGSFEERVKVHGRPGVGKIDYFAPRKFLIEQKSRGRNLDDAYEQALEYFDSLAGELRPRYIIVSDFARIRIYDLEQEANNRIIEFTLEDLATRVRELAFFAEEEVQSYKPEEHIDVRAVKVIGKLHKALKESNYPPEDLPRLLTRLVFCFFADDIGIFERNSLRRFFEENTRADGADVGEKLHNIFEVLDTPDGTSGSKNERQTGMLDELRALPWVNGGMFKGHVRLLQGTREIRDMLLECMAFDWSQVSPAIFGSMFQSVMNEKERHDLGAHYTSETNIKKVINGLFLEELQQELDVASTNKERLNTLWDKIARITLLDPACGCGNFLVISYRELRIIENEIIRRLHGKADKRALAHAESHTRLDFGVDIAHISRLSIERMYGIELDKFPVEIAKLSLWLVDHKMNMDLGAIFGTPFKKLPLKEQPNIVQGNALQMDWESVVPKDQLSYILGNPPFLGKSEQNKEQKADMLEVFGKTKGVGELDYVTSWYKKAAQYIQGTEIAVAFVSTNSISQGEQPGILWSALQPLGVRITFAHRTFKWSNEATGKAAVHCVIVGFALYQHTKKRIWDGDIVVEAGNINPYLVDAPDVLILSRRRPICEVPSMMYGSKPADGGFLMFSDEEQQKISDPIASKYIRQLLSAKEYFNGEKRWCFWLVEADPSDLKESNLLRERIAAVRQFRELSAKVATQELAQTPYRFAEIRQPASAFLLVPRHSSENRIYVPFGFFTPDHIVHDSCAALPEATWFHFGIMQSLMHMAWMRAVCGRLEMRYRYSNELVYNNFPWPTNLAEEQKMTVEKAAQSIMHARADYKNKKLATLYDPNAMPTDLLAAHKALDKAVDACYSKRSFKSEPERLEFLFEKYQELVATADELKPLVRRVRKAPPEHT